MVIEKKFTLEEYAFEEDAKLHPVYISGPVSLLPYEVARTRFMNTQKRLENAGFHIIENPVVFCNREWQYEACMRLCIQKLLQCKAIVMQRLWWISSGARLERKLAISLGINVVYE